MGSKKVGRTVQWQKTREVTGKKKYSGESSPYWGFLTNHNRANVHREQDQDQSEYPTANPDVLAADEEQGPPDFDTREAMRKVLEQARFSRQEKAVLNCLGLQGFTEEKTAETLGISRRAVRICLARAQKKCEKLFAAKSRRTGVYNTPEE